MLLLLVLLSCDESNNNPSKDVVLGDAVSPEAPTARSGAGLSELRQASSGFARPGGTRRSQHPHKRNSFVRQSRKELGITDHLQTAPVRGPRTADNAHHSTTAAFQNFENSSKRPAQCGCRARLPTHGHRLPPSKMRTEAMSTIANGLRHTCTRRPPGFQRARPAATFSCSCTQRTPGSLRSPDGNKSCSSREQSCARRTAVGSFILWHLVRQPLAAAKLVVPSGPSSKNLDQALRVSRTQSRATISCFVALA